MQKLTGQAVTVELAEAKAPFQMILPMTEMLFDVAKAIKRSANQAGLLNHISVAPVNFVFSPMKID
jgi:hypothetical protein